MGNLMSFPRNYADTTDSTMKFDVPDMLWIWRVFATEACGLPKRGGHATMRPQKSKQRTIEFMRLN